MYTLIKRNEKVKLSTTLCRDEIFFTETISVLLFHLGWKVIVLRILLRTANGLSKAYTQLYYSIPWLC